MDDDTPILSGNPAPQDLYRAYGAGLVGSLRDPNHLIQFLAENPRPLFSAASTTMDPTSGAITSLEGSGTGQIALLYKSLQRFDKTAYEQEGQTTGDCVSHAMRNAVDTTRAVEIDINGEAESFMARGATEPIYGCRGHSGQGMSCSRAAKWVSSDGGYLLRKDYGFIDLSVYDARIGTKMGRNGVPDNVREKADDHQIRTISLVTNVEEARDAIFNGYSIAVCSSQGFSNVRDTEGFAAPKSNWSHGMAWTAVDDKSSRKGFLVCNSWGKWNSGPKKFDQPNGSFWIDYSVAKKMLAARGAWVVSNFEGFPPQTLPQYLTGVLG
jgi:hypothetical protein